VAPYFASNLFTGVVEIKAEIGAAFMAFFHQRAVSAKSRVRRLSDHDGGGHDLRRAFDLLREELVEHAIERGELRTLSSLIRLTLSKPALTASRPRRSR